jgi:ubiquinone/menaquinone biosynthesis C-methylase UbiE
LYSNQGHVFAVDHNPKMLDMARERARETGLSNLTFIEGGFDVTLPEPGTLDAAVGRRVLMYQPDATQAVARLARAVRKRPTSRPSTTVCWPSASRPTQSASGRWSFGLGLENPKEAAVRAKET